MATPVRSRPRDKRYLGNSSSTKKEVHDLRNEDTGGGGCQIREIVAAGHAVVFSPDALAQAKSEGYDPCAKCLTGSRR
jgi:hypothetical protein